MAPSRRRMDGFSDDGLSYSVAGDFEKQMAQAMAEQEARTRKPRFVAGARVEEPDAPDLLQRELVDPVLAGFGMGRQTTSGLRSRPNSIAQPKFYEMGNQLISVDPTTQRTSVLHTAPEKIREEPRYEVPSGLDVFGKPSGTLKLTLPELEMMAPSFPDQIRTNAPVTSLLELNRSRQSAAAPIQQSSVEVIKPLKNGRKAVFNSNTKEFIRYAD